MVGGVGGEELSRITRQQTHVQFLSVHLVIADLRHSKIVTTGALKGLFR